MTRQEALDLIRELLASYSGVDPLSIDPQTDVQEELGIDSIDAVELLITVERRTGLRFDVEQLDELRTVDDLVGKLLDASFDTTVAVS